MGTSRDLYLGPYLKCSYHTETKTVERRGCPKCKEPKYHSSKFCPDCGTELGTYEEEVKAASADYYDMDDLIDVFNTQGEYANHDGFEILMPNMYRDAPRSFSISEDFSHLNLKDVDVDVEMKWLETAFEEEIGLLYERYDSVEVCWGVVQWWS